MKQKVLISIAILLATCTIHGESISEILLSSDSDKDKKEKILEKLETQLQKGKVVPKIATREELVKFFRIMFLPAFAGSLPFDLGYHDRLYFIQILPSAEGGNHSVYVSLEKQIETDEFIGILAGESVSNDKIKNIKFFFPEVKHRTQPDR